MKRAVDVAVEEASAALKLARDAYDPHNAKTRRTYHLAQIAFDDAIAKRQAFSYAQKVGEERRQTWYRPRLFPRAVVNDDQRIRETMERYGRNSAIWDGHDADFAATSTKKIGQDHPLDLVEEQAANDHSAAKVWRNVADDSIALMFSRGHITMRHYEAAQRLRADDELSMINPLRSAGFEGSVRGGGAPGGISDAQIDAQKRKHKCLERLGQVGSDVVRSVVLRYEPLSAVGKRYAWPQSYWGPRLKEALDVVADYYRIYHPSVDIRRELFGAA